MPNARRSPLIRRITTAAALGLAPCLIVAAPAQAHPRTPDGVIAFARGGDLWRVGADGHGLRRLTSGAAVESEPAWSPDGTRLAYTRTVDGDSDVWVLATGGGARPLVATPAAESSPAWSPDGRLLAFARRTESPAGPPTASVHVADRDGGGETLLAAGAGAPAWSPDGGRIALGAGGDNGRLELVAADGSGRRPVEGTGFTGEGEIETAPAWSPDGTRIAYAHLRYGVTPATSRLAVIGADGASATLVPLAAPYNPQPAWSPDGTRIAFTRAVAGVTRIEVVGAKGGTPRRVRGTLGGSDAAWTAGTAGR